MRDCFYGNYADMNNEWDWRDDFFPNKDAMKKAQAKYRDGWLELLDEIARDNHLDTEYWELDDYYELVDIMGL